MRVGAQDVPEALQDRQLRVLLAALEDKAAPNNVSYVAPQTSRLSVGIHDVVVAERASGMVASLTSTLFKSVDIQANTLTIKARPHSAMNTRGGSHIQIDSYNFIADLF